MDKRRLANLTVVEIMVALAIAAIMMFFALPAFNDFTAQRRVAANVNYVISAINYARNEAARRGVNVHSFPTGPLHPRCGRAPRRTSP